MPHTSLPKCLSGCVTKIMFCHLPRDPAGIMSGFAGGAFLLMQQRPMDSPRMARAEIAGTATYNHMLNTVHRCNPQTWKQDWNMWGCWNSKATSLRTRSSFVKHQGSASSRGPVGFLKIWHFKSSI